MRKAVLLAVLCLLGACSSDPGAPPKVPEFTPAKTTTTDLDYSNVNIKSVPGKTPGTTVVLQGGQATLSGSVIGDEGAVAGAKVNIERIVNGQVGQIVLLTADDGSWSLPMIRGGRYRVRAWRAPDLAQTNATAVFLGQAETKTLELKVRTISGASITSSFAPKSPRIDRDTNLVIRVAQKTVDDDGIVRAAPIAGVRAELGGSSFWTVRTPNPAFTDSSGLVEWTLRCRDTGEHGLTVTVGNTTVPLDVAACVDPTEATTTTDPGEIITPTTQG